MNKKAIKKYLLNPYKIFALLGSKNKMKFIPDPIYLKLIYHGRTGKRLRLQNPQTYNEKLQWLKLKDRKSFYTKMVDKYEVRQYISDTIGSEYLIPLIGIYDSFDDINFNNLPTKFVLKCTHDSGGIVICEDKYKLDKASAKEKLNKSLNKNYFYSNREWPYKDIKPRIICEKYMTDESMKELKDYKIYCFNGQPKLIQVDYNRFTNHKRNLYDTEWNYLPASIEYPTNAEIKIEKPNNLEKMLELAKKLSNDYAHIRIDLYSINEKIYFGEKTFYPEGGFAKFRPESLNEEMGNWIQLNI